MGERLGAGLPQVRDRLLPYLALESMVRQALDLFGQPIGVERLDSFHKPGMECALAVLVLQL